MDLERIKQNLRLRSGRLKKKSRKPTVQSKASDPHSSQAGSANPPARPPTAAVHSPAKKQPAPHNGDTGIALSPITLVDSAGSLEHRPDIPRAATGPDLRSDLPDLSSRYGRSGIERPLAGASPQPTRDPPAVQRTMSETDTGAFQNLGSDVLDFDLRPPPPRCRIPSVESLSESLFSSGHLKTLLRHPGYLARFTSFLAMYQPQSQSVLLNFLEIQKAIKAVEYANAVAQGIAPLAIADEDSPSIGPSTAATLDKAFEESSEAAFHVLADTALPAYITYNLVKVVSECLIHEITGRQTTFLEDSVGGLSEVFCLTDPNQEDNPIIYASSEFYRFTGYGPDDVIGRNCRFLQGTRTKRESVSRLRSGIENGHEICETLLNYRRDGRPFINLLLIAPLHDDKGNVKYYIGAQADVTGLVERGSGLDGFGRYLVTEENETREGEIGGTAVDASSPSARKSKVLAKLRDLSETFDLEESAVVRSHSRSASTARDDDERSIGSSRRAPRRLIPDSDGSSVEEGGDQARSDGALWTTLGDSGRFDSSGRLPGVYDSYMLIRPAPSLRIVFVSSKLRRRLGNIVQHPFLSHVAAPSKTLSGLQESFETGVPVSAKIHFMYSQGDRSEGTKISPDKQLDEAGQSRVCWISATPLLGSDNNIGVWMVVVVDTTKVFTTSRLENGAETNVNHKPISTTTGRPTKITIPARESTGERQQSRPSKQPDQDGPPRDTSTSPTRLEQVADTTNIVPSTSSPVHNGFLDDNEDKQANHEGPQGVEEPQSNLAAQNSAEQDSDFVPVNTNHTRLGFDSPAGSNDDSGRLAIQAHGLEEWQQAHHEAGGGSDGDPDAPMTLDLDGDLYHALAGLKAGAEGVDLDSPYARETSDEANVLHSFSDDEDTPRRPQRLSHFDNGSASPSRAGTSTMEASPMKSNSKHYMDYLRHPGSRASSEYNRPLSGSGLLSSMYHAEGADDDTGDDGEDFNDAQCARTPYSVD
ncbi:hypothetical protein A1O3_09592 [Capronia epimyces CBS 606.96]|uniref:PAC domain-containing protein n=1 Tax=Capronia epimyces CBS 606.96 TaxID=1182542 RepID=W9XKA3_9EURO|nr:uncharacterized protein A1O3_09592 [Capronia epimyces CBS 606.96]EXJ77366.1 hypothetical protein A1O3_09592 [Capronia epimyces CBS 606.96]